MERLGGDGGARHRGCELVVARLYLTKQPRVRCAKSISRSCKSPTRAVSPDGKNVAFIEGLMSDEGSTGGDIQLFPITGGAARNLTPGIKVVSVRAGVDWARSHYLRAKTWMETPALRASARMAARQDAVDRRRMGPSDRPCLDLDRIINGRWPDHGHRAAIGEVRRRKYGQVRLETGNKSRI